jgi:hypothetical protein
MISFPSVLPEPTPLCSTNSFFHKHAGVQTNRDEMRFFAVVAFAALSLPAGAHAGKKRVGVLKFDGAQEVTVRKEVTRALERQGYELVTASEVAAAAAEGGVDLDSDDGFKAVAKALGVAAFVTGEVGAKTARITVRGGADGAVKSDARFAAANLHKLAAQIRESFWERLGSSVERGRAPTPGEGGTRAAATGEAERKTGGAGDSRVPEASDDTGQGDADAHADADRPRPRRRARARATSEETDIAVTAERAEPTTGKRWLELGLGARGFSRNLRYHQDLAPTLRPYELGLGPAIVADLAFYPLALAVDGPAADIGLVAQFEQAVGTSSQVAPDGTYPNGAMFATSMQEISGGLRYRIPVGGSQIGIAATGGQHAFFFTGGDGADRSQLLIPNAIYRFVRGGVDARLALTPDFYLAAGAGYRHILNGAGPIRDYFPHLTVAGVDAQVGLGYRMTPTMEARVQGDIRRYFYDMHSVAGDAWLAGGAVDQYLSVAAGVAVTME